MFPVVVLGYCDSINRVKQTISREVDELNDIRIALIQGKDPGLLNKKIKQDGAVALKKIATVAQSLTHRGGYSPAELRTAFCGLESAMDMQKRRSSFFSRTAGALRIAEQAKEHLRKEMGSSDDYSGPLAAESIRVDIEMEKFSPVLLLAPSDTAKPKTETVPEIPSPEASSMSILKPNWLGHLPYKKLR